MPADSRSRLPSVARLKRWGLLAEIERTTSPPIRTYSLDVGPFALTGSPPAAADGVAEGYSVRIAGSVRTALACLSERDRETLLLTSWDGLDSSRAAAAFGCSPGTFAVRLHRARNRFARALTTPSPSNASTFKEFR